MKQSMLSHTTVQRARDYAVRMHGDQKYGDEPYVVHLDEVVIVLDEVTSDIDTLTAGYLHDVIEDAKHADGSSVTVMDVRAEFGEAVAAIVWAVTGVGANRQERMESIYRKIKACPYPHKATAVKCADRLQNTRRSKANNPRLWKMYCEEYPRFGCNLSAWGPRRLWKTLDAVVKGAVL